MARKSTTDAPGKIGGATLTRALRELERIASFARDSVRLTHATASIATAEDHSWQLGAHASFRRLEHFPESRSLADRPARDAGSRSHADHRLHRSETDNPGKTVSGANRWNRTRETVEAGLRLSREIQVASPAIGALSQVEASAGSGSAAQAISTASRRATLMLAANAEASVRSRKKFEARRPAYPPAGFLAGVRIAASIRGVIPPPNLSRRELAGPTGGVRAPRHDGIGAAITINSSPMVVINGPAAGGSVQREVIGALRAHREELFDEFKRESARRERTQF
jgi:hypothetical protein